MERWFQRVILVLSAGACAGAHAQVSSFAEDFEDDALGVLPGTPWFDASTLIDVPTVPSPSSVVTQTTGSDGSATRALQTVDAIGTSSGAFFDIEKSTAHFFRANVRIDQFTDTTGGATWAAAVGYLDDEGEADLNNNPQAVVYAGRTTPEFNLYVFNNNRATNLVIPGASVEVGVWYTIEMDVDTETGAFDVRVFDALTGQLNGSLEQTIGRWSADTGAYDTFGFFDGEYRTTSGTRGGLASLDDVFYRAIPAPGSGAILAGALAYGARRRR